MLRACLCLMMLLSGWAVVGCASRGPRTDAVAPGAAYLRLRTDDAGTIHLESAVRTFGGAGRGGGRIVLAGALHLGTPEYFRELQALVDTEPVVLFEGVGGDNETGPGGSAAGYALQPALAEALGLVFQLDAMDTRRPGYHNSDLTLSQLDQVIRDAAPEAAAPMGQLMGVMDGSSWLGGVVRFGVGLIRSSPKLRATTRLVLAETLGGLDADLSDLAGMPDEVRALLEVLIDERNRVVVGDLERWRASEPRPSGVAVLYGAGHMPDLERRIRGRTGCRSLSEIWVTAFSVNPAQAGLSPAEVELARSLARAQRTALGGAGPDGADAGTSRAR